MDLRIEGRILFYFKELTTFFGFVFIGTILFFISYAIFIFFKDLLITYARRNDRFERGYYYKYIEYIPYIKPVSIFTVIITCFWTVVLFLEWRMFIIKSGFILFSIGYVISLIYHYVINKNHFDLFDDYIWIYNKLKRPNTETVKKD